MAKLFFSKNKLFNNIIKLNELLEINGISLNLVTKFCLSKKEILQTFLEDKIVQGISDSNMINFIQLPENLASYYNRSLIKTRISDIKSLPDIPKYARPTRLFVSDKALLEELKQLPKSVVPEIILIIENGDNKEGFLPQTVSEVLDSYSELNIKGISTNYSCLSGNLPTEESVKELAELANFVSKKTNKPPFFSIGGTVVYDLLKAGKLKGLVQEVRMGEGVFFGYDSSSGKKIPELENNIFRLEGEILEVCCKEILPSENDGGFTAIGEKMNVKIPTGIRKRAVLDFGILVSSFKNLSLSDLKITYVGQTFDFSVLDITESTYSYSPGNYISFIPDYGGVSQAMINPFVNLCVV